VSHKRSATARQLPANRLHSSGHRAAASQVPSLLSLRFGGRKRDGVAALGSHSGGHGAGHCSAVARNDRSEQALGRRSVGPDLGRRAP